ncbi:MAG: hypothetical protein HY924_03520 [Elusimicrobia bacterium]|nr:hypothetical protein [Elusimicrobiota bacterium]
MRISSAVAVSALFVLCSGLVSAKEPPKAGSQAEAEGGKPGRKDANPQEQLYAKLPDKLATELELTDAQKTQVKAAVEKSRAKLEAMQAEMKTLHERMRKEMFSMKEGIRENLTMDQKERFDMVIAKFMGRMMGGGQGMGPGGRQGMRGGMGPQGRQGMMRGEPGMDEEGMDPEAAMRRKMKMRRMKKMQEPGFEEEGEIEGGPEGD